MSASEPSASNLFQTAPAEPDPLFIKFPPFPSPPPGVTIMSFKDFKPRGIQLFSEPGSGNVVEDEEDAELDALGIPTVELRIKHTTDECKSNSRKKRKKKKSTAASALEPAKKLPWYEEWEEGEDLRVTNIPYDPNIPPVDRFFQSAFDFRTGRPWPPIASGLNNLWDQFRLFCGLLVNPSIYRKDGGKKCARAESPDFMSDDEDDPPMNVKGDTSTRPAKRQKSGDGMNADGDEVSIHDSHKLDEEVREEKISIFLNDPEKAVRIFLSSYMRERGLIWSERNLIYMPRLVSFFLTFVLRNRVLEPSYQRGLRQALETIQWAKKELPLTHKVGQFIPDAFNEACRECFGRQGGMNWSVFCTTETTAEQKSTNPTITTVDLPSGVATSITLPTEVQTQLKDAIEDNVDDVNVSLATSSTTVPSTNENAADENSGGWGGSGWGDISGTGWGDEQGTWSQGSGTWGDNEQDASGEVKWGASNPSWNRDLFSLLSLLGPSAFALTHTTGIIELSTRRVTEIHFPPNHSMGVPAFCTQTALGRVTGTGNEGQGWMPSADGVEAELDTRFAKVILEPWGREEGDIAPPEIWRTSRGPVIDPDRSKTAPTFGGTRKPHDPLKDNITLLIAPSFAETLQLVPGLGLGAMWIELARQKRGGKGDLSIGAAEVDYDTSGRFWYHEDVTGIFPSFYTPGEKE